MKWTKRILIGYMVVFGVMFFTPLLGHIQTSPFMWAGGFGVSWLHYNSIVHGEIGLGHFPKFQKRLGSFLTSVLSLIIPWLVLAIGHLSYILGQRNPEDSFAGIVVSMLGIISLIFFAAALPSISDRIDGMFETMGNNRLTIARKRLTQVNIIGDPNNGYQIAVGDATTELTEAQKQDLKLQ
jgi:hypothetical protein